MIFLQAASPEGALRRMLTAALGDGASDIHIEPMRSFVRIRFRKDGLLYEYGRLPLSMMKGMAVRAKVLGMMDIGESRLPQDGSHRFSEDGLSCDLRLSTLPSLYGETIVIRLLSDQLAYIEKNTLGMLPSQKKIFETCLSSGSGMILTTGPTGSGKTSTLYAALRRVDRETRNVISIEDPVEYRLDGVTQIQVNEKAGLTFASGLRSMVRQDPDIIMVGEIRDRETAEMAVHAALTGHLVLSSLHTNSASEAPLRLSDMGIPPYLLAASMTLVISQRLVGRICPDCKKEITLSAKEAADLSLPAQMSSRPLYTGSGCDSCHHTGLSGRTGIFEMLRIGKDERHAIHDNASPDELSALMKAQGQPSLASGALRLLEAGIISPREAALIMEEQK